MSITYLLYRLCLHRLLLRHNELKTAVWDVQILVLVVLNTMSRTENKVEFLNYFLYNLNLKHHKKSKRVAIVSLAVQILDKF